MSLLEKTIKSNCDCSIGYLSGEKIKLSTFGWEVKRVSDMQFTMKEQNLLWNKKAPLKPLQLIDNRRGYLSRFIFCPYCGTKINWKMIINKLL